MSENIDLTITVSPETRKIIDTIAHREGVSAENFLQNLLNERIRLEKKQPVSLEQIRAILNTHRDELLKRSIRRLYVFGSVARGDAGNKSDIDIMVEFAPSARVSLLTLGSLNAFLEEILGSRVDVGDRQSFRSDVLCSIEKEAVGVFG
jgi:predicted nucleotidyltransferase